MEIPIVGFSLSAIGFVATAAADPPMASGLLVMELCDLSHILKFGNKL
jgi:hypothetical protein